MVVAGTPVYYYEVPVNDMIGIVLYYLKNVKFLSLLYMILLALAVKGLCDWLKTSDESEALMTEGGMTL
jgi:nicotinamide mononucleotide transporter